MIHRWPKEPIQGHILSVIAITLARELEILGVFLRIHIWLATQVVVVDVFTVSVS